MSLRSSLTKMSARVFAKPIELPSYETGTQSNYKFSTKLVAVLCSIALFLGLFVYQQVRVEAALQRTESVQDISRNILVRVKLIENVTEDDIRANVTALEISSARVEEWKDEKDLELNEIRLQLETLKSQAKNQSLQNPAPSQSTSVHGTDVKVIHDDRPFEYPTGQANCTGHILLGSGVSNLSYGVPLEGAFHGCVWIVQSETEGSIIVSRRSLFGHKGSELNNMSLVVAFKPVHVYKNCNYISLLTSRTVTLAESIVFIFFNGPPGSGFRLDIQVETGKRSPKNMSFVRRIGPFTYKYPPGSDYYGHNQLFAMVAFPEQGQAVRLILSGIHTEHKRDWLSLMWWGSENSLRCLAKSGDGWESISGSAAINFPIVVFFESDGDNAAWRSYHGFYIAGEVLK